MKKAVVTGGAGFVGSHLCDYLLGEGCRVVCVDNFSTGSERNISHLARDSHFDLVEQDVVRQLKIAGCLDYVLHFASPASPKDYLELPIETLQVGSIGTQNALDLAREKGSEFLLASTSECYGDPLVTPQPESYWGNVNPIGPRSVYDEAKRYAEAITMAYTRHYGLKTRIVRIFNTYGPRMRLNDGRALPNFVYQALMGRSLTVYGDGSQTRSFCYISDLIQGIYKLMLSDVNEPVNIGNPHEFTVLDLAKKIIKLTDTTSDIIFKDLPVDDPKTRCPDITKAKKHLDWQPEVDVDEGLKKTIEWFKHGS